MQYFTNLLILAVCNHAYAFRAFNFAFNGKVKGCPCGSVPGNCLDKDADHSCSETEVTVIGPIVDSTVSGRFYVDIKETFQNEETAFSKEQIAAIGSVIYHAK